jgi:hypothetical protein
MHTRRVGAFLIGGWLLGMFLMAFVTSQGLVNVERIMNSPPEAVAKDMDDLGSDVTRQLLRFGALQLSRHLTETWEVMQLGIAGALLATSFLTSHRSRFVIGGTVLMAGIVAYLYFSLSPAMNQVARTYDFLPATAALREREIFRSYSMWYTALSILQGMIGLVIAGRLLFDRYDWKAKLIGATPPAVSHGKVRRRRRSSASPYVSERRAGSSVIDVSDKVDAVDNADDSHVDR